jgi:hypothetical protein
MTCERLLELLLSPSKYSHGIKIHPGSKSMEVETMDPFIGYTNQKGKKTDIAQRANPPLPQTWRSTHTTTHTPITSPAHLRDQHQPPITDQTHTPEPPDSPNQMDKYTTIRNILQAGVAAMETIENPKPEDTPKDVTVLIKLLSHKLTITEHKQDTKTIENHLEHLNQKIDHLTKPSHPRTKSKMLPFLNTANICHTPCTTPPENNQTPKTPWLDTTLAD